MERIYEKAVQKAIHKEEGTVGDFIAILIAILAGIIIMLAAIGFSGDGKKKTEIDDLGRTAILRMDDTGCLTAEMRNDLTAALTELGCRNIDYSGTTMLPADYGSPIYLKVTFEMPASDLSMENNNIFAFRQTTRYVTSGIYRESRSKMG